MVVTVSIINPLSPRSTHKTTAQDLRSSSADRPLPMGAEKHAEVTYCTVLRVEEVKTRPTQMFLLTLEN